jgi:hypothetical protein
MTGREWVNRQMRWRVAILLVPLPIGMLVIPLFAVALTMLDLPAALPLIAFSVLIVAWVGMFFGTFFLAVRRWRCPNCEAPLLRYFTSGGWRTSLFEMPRAYRYCPYCGYCFDHPLPGK